MKDVESELSDSLRAKNTHPRHPLSLDVRFVLGMTSSHPYHDAHFYNITIHPDAT
jgi:hypothetical protein